MRPRRPYRLPKDKERQIERAKRLEWITIGFMLSIITIVGLTMGSSQAMRTAWIEDWLTLIPPLAFLIAMRWRAKPPNARFPYGYRRVVTIAYVCAALTLTLFGVVLLFEAVMTLIHGEHPTIGTVELFGREIWLGWLMIAALAYSAIPPVILGRIKEPLAEEIHEKVLHADAKMQKADWLTALAGILGILGVGIGWWWADALAAGIISLDVLRDGGVNLKRSIADLMDERPRTVQGDRPDPLAEELQQRLEQLSWVAEAEVRLREEGDVYTGEAYVVPKDEHHLLERLRQAAELANSFHWRIYDVVVTPLRSSARSP